MSVHFNVQEINKKFDEFEAKLEEHGPGSITTKEFAEMVPWLGADGRNTPAKEALLKTFGNIVTRRKRIEYLKRMTTGKDFGNFRELIKMLDLKLDDSHMIIFNDQLRHAELKQEPLFIWWIMEILHTHPFISQYRTRLYANVQESMDTTIAGRSAKRYDIVFPKLRIVLEIDETGHEDSSVKPNDSLKNDIVRLNGYALIRITTKQMLACVSYEDRPFTGAKNELVRMRDHIVNVFIGSLMRYEQCRKDRLSFLFHETLVTDSLKLRDRIEAISTKLAAIDDTDSNEYKSLVRMKNGLIYNKYNTDNLLDSLDNNIVSKLFNLKHKTETSNKAIISFDNIRELVKFTNEVAYIDLYNFILDNGLFDENYKFTWKTLSKIITDCGIKEFEESKKVLGEYYRNVETYYELFIKDIKNFYKMIVSSKDHYEQYAVYIRDTLYDKLTKQTCDMQNDIKELTKEISELKKELAFFHKRKHDMFVDQLCYDGKSDYCEILLSNLECIEYDFLTEHSKNKEFDSSLNNIKTIIKAHIDKYEEYYDKKVRAPIEFNPDEFDKEAFIRDSEEFMKRHRPVLQVAYQSADGNESDGIKNDPDDLF